MQQGCAMPMPIRLRPRRLRLRVAPQGQTGKRGMSTAVEAALKAAKAALKSGDPVAATRALMPEIKRFPGNARLLTQLAEVQAARTGLPPRPFGPHHLQRLLQIRAQGGPAVAAEEAQVALLLDPFSPLANGVLGSLLMDLGQAEAAIAPLRVALKRDPKSPEVGTNLAIALRLSGQSAEAVAVARATQAHHPELVPARAALALALVEDGLPLEAAALLQSMIAQTPTSADLHFELGRALFAAQRFDEARAAFEAAVALDPKHDRALNELGSAVLTAGDFTRACEIFQTAIKAHPGSAAGYYNLARSKDVTPGDPLIAQMQALEAKTPRPADRILLNFGLAKAFEDAGQVEESFAALKRANDQRRALYPYDPAQEIGFFKALKARHWSPKAQLAAASPARRPIFILGMMRSGTTLMEQIISAHPQVYGAGELDYLGKAVMAEMSKGSAPLDAAAMARIRDHYLTRLANLPGDTPFVTDKMPANFALVGVILRALPEARILHMRRDPIAVCWSIYKKNFTGNRLRFSNDLNDIAAYYDAYADYMAFAETEAPGAICHIDYAELTKTP
ncbi:MAG: sulfotransferase family protein [Pseudorhodobacter sp.]|nr:MAG: sulfotransferase family protein [Pseudorhodobacter sp.]